MPLPVPVPRTWSVGDLETAALFNSQIRDANLFLLNQPLFRGHASGAQSIGNGGWVQLALDTADIDTYGGWSSTTNTRYTAQLAGFYEVSGVGAWVSNATGIRGSAITINGATVTAATATEVAAIAGSASMAPTEDLIYLNVGDYISLWVYQNSGASLSTVATGSRLIAKWSHQ